MTPCLESQRVADVEAVDEKDLVLDHVFVLFRHGDRSPLHRRISSKVNMTQHETDFWVSRLAELSVVETLNSGTQVVKYHEGDCKCDQELDLAPEPQQGGRWPCGQLTAKGIEMMRAKGQHLRERYTAFMVDMVDPIRQVHVQSTNIRRTIRSAQSLLAGLFPEYFENVTVDNMLAANAHLLPDSRSFLANVQLHRSKVRKNGKFLIHADDANSLAPQHAYELYQDLGKLLVTELKQHPPSGFEEVRLSISELIGTRSRERVSWTGCSVLVREVLICRQAHGLAFPNGLNQQLFAQICEYDAWLWHHLYGNMTFCRSSFKTGVERIYAYLLGVMKLTFTGECQGIFKHKLSLFSAHDNSLVAFMNALQLQSPRVIPPYGAVLIFELFRHRNTGDFYLKVLYEGIEVTFPGHEHSALCPILVFHQAIQTFLQSDAAS
ncbi:hypothetical protein PsorP6_011494 [Peronosclerospora sorghi]|uniref:Uncharacterized protein n=1 Tax=Peronosclerospora sorghi TaxID=230839 RepID=A0ACC0WM46_9STRA|nr:hypothetical protein PsorP6_011494 [Peronosclerospora sorghi]